MNDRVSVKKIATLGPASNTEHKLRQLKDRDVNFVRVNMSHSSIQDLRFFIALAKKVGIPFMLDTEGSQIRTGSLKKSPLYLESGDKIKLYSDELKGNKRSINLRPGSVLEQLQPGDILRLDFNTLILRVIDVSNISQKYISAEVLSDGMLGENKGVAVDPASGRQCVLPTLSPKDLEAIDIGLSEGITQILASFMRSGSAVDEVRQATKGRMKIISKIECVDGLENLDDIIEKSDFLLIDRGDLSKEIPLERIPLTQKLIINRARNHGKEVIVATNLLETMVREPKPTRAEVHDIVNTIIDGAAGLTLAAETAIGKYPIEAADTLNRIIKHVEKNVDVKSFADKESKLVSSLEDQDYLLNYTHASLVSPHGGKLVNRIPKNIPSSDSFSNLPKVDLTEEQFMDTEQISIGTFSPIEGFMSKKEIDSVLDDMRLPSGVVWPIPIVLDVSKEKARSLSENSDVALYFDNKLVGMLHLDEKFTFDKKEYSQKLYNTLDKKHPGVRAVNSMEPVLLSGKVELFHRRDSSTKYCELTPAQTRSMFEERGWSKVVGFHTRNVIHRSHEFIQLKAMEDERCDGLFIHPVIGKKKAGDFHSKYIIESYNTMIDKFYPKSKAVFGAFTTFSRYAGPREALFTAICRKNFGCSHFIVGRDHTGVGDFYHPKASHEIFDQFPDLGIKAVTFDEVFYSKDLDRHVHLREDPKHDPEDMWNISGTEARKILELGKLPPSWFMRKKIAQLIIDSIKRGEEVFVKKTNE